jgi:Protein of unknwon function (DUF3310)
MKRKTKRKTRAPQAGGASPAGRLPKRSAVTTPPASKPQGSGERDGATSKAEPTAHGKRGGKTGDASKRETVNHPTHYNEHPSGVECVTIAEGFNFNVGNAVKYLWRAGLKGNRIEDLKKAQWYVEREIFRLLMEGVSP